MIDVLLVTTYFLVVAPVGWVSRLVHDPLSRRRDRRATTYWIESTQPSGPAPARRRSRL
jgi:hypothetical protein